MVLQSQVKRGPTIIKTQVKPNNLLLLNINVRPRNAASVVVNAAKRKDLGMVIPFLAPLFLGMPFYSRTSYNENFSSVYNFVTAHHGKFSHFILRKNTVTA